MKALALWVAVAGAAYAAPKFRSIEIATDLSGGYQVVAADVNRDGRPDLIALASRTPDLVWFENPSWTKHVIAGPFDRMINLAASDLDGDGVPEIVLASGFSNEAKKSPGIVHVLRHRGDPKQKWEVVEIDRLPSSHRIRVAEFDKGKPVFVNAPLTASDAEGPEYRGSTPLVFYRPGEWKRVEISSENQGVVHELSVVDWDGDGWDDLLTASFEGVHRFYRRGGKWIRERILAGETAPWPKGGASEVAVGSVGGKRFLATVEPWHGNQIVVYFKQGEEWIRNVIDDSQADVHALRIADLNQDGRDDIVAAVRGPQRRVSAYFSADTSGKRWNRSLLDDGGIAAASCDVLDFNGDRRPDVACIGSAMANLKLYENLGSLP